MKLLNRKLMVAMAGLGGLSAMLLMPITSQAECRYDHCHPNHYYPNNRGYPYNRWHPAGQWSRTNHCYRTVYRRYCHMRNGWQECYTVPRTRFVCVY